MTSRGIENLKVVMWRLKEKHKGKPYMSKQDVEEAIIRECGIDPRTIKNNMAILKRLGWIKADRKCYYIGDKDHH